MRREHHSLKNFYLPVASPFRRLALALLVRVVYLSSQAPDKAGILKFVLRHARLGYSSLLIRESGILVYAQLLVDEHIHAVSAL